MGKKTIEDRIIDLKNAGISLEGVAKIRVGFNLNEDELFIFPSEEIKESRREIKCSYTSKKVKDDCPKLKSFDEGDHWINLTLTNKFIYRIYNIHPRTYSRTDEILISADEMLIDKKAKEYKLSQFWR